MVVIFFTLLEPPDYTSWHLFFQTNRGEQWSIHPYGIKWLVSRFYRFENLLGLEGCSQSLFDTCMRKKVRELKIKLRDELYAKFSRPYDYTYMLGDNPSVAALALAEEVSFSCSLICYPSCLLQRIIKRIGSLLRSDVDRDPSANFFKMMFDRVRRPIPRDIWYQENEEEVGPLVRDKMIELGWTPATSRQKTLPTEMAARKEVFESLPDEDQEKYLDKAAAWKPKEPTR